MQKKKKERAYEENEGRNDPYVDGQSKTICQVVIIKMRGYDKGLCI